MADDNITDPHEDPLAEGHLLVSGELGGQVSHHDPINPKSHEEPDMNMPDEIG
jgi:hypothetical protein